MSTWGRSAALAECPLSPALPEWSSRPAALSSSDVATPARPAERRQIPLMISLAQRSRAAELCYMSLRDPCPRRRALRSTEWRGRLPACERCPAVARGADKVSVLQLQRRGLSSASSHIEAGPQAQLRRRARSCWPVVVAGSQSQTALRGGGATTRELTGPRQRVPDAVRSPSARGRQPTSQHAGAQVGRSSGGLQQAFNKQPELRWTLVHSDLCDRRCRQVGCSGFGGAGLMGVPHQAQRQRVSGCLRVRERVLDDRTPRWRLRLQSIPQ
jgi:hypothetical protein